MTANPLPVATMTQDSADWIRDAVVYEVYLRSFADADGDGVGDLRGLVDRLDYLADLGVDALWITPWYPSPMADGGYDVADYRAIDPAFGTLSDADRLIAAAHARDIRVIIDMVPNHCSSEHPWFRRALAAAPGSPDRSRFWFRPGRGAEGEQPPNNWQSVFGGPAWTRTTTAAGEPGEWYLHLFAAEQPDFNWTSPEVQAEFIDILRFWFDRGVDGIRIDSAAVLAKDPTLADVSEDAGDHYADRDGNTDIYREWRRLADSYPGGRALIGEVWLPDRDRMAAYLAPAEGFHTAFNFDFIATAWEVGALRTVIDESLATYALADAPASWVVSNHDLARTVTRYGRADTKASLTHRPTGVPSDLRLGARRARAVALLLLALPGAFFVYQGDELGLPEVEDLPDRVRQDPIWTRSGHTDPGRDGCRVPLPWAGDTAPFGFSPPGAAGSPHLPQPVVWAGYTVAAEQADPASMLGLYRSALALRRTEPALHSSREALTWTDSEVETLMFRRGEDFACLLNLSSEPVALPRHQEVLLASAPLTDGLLPTDGAVWLRVSDAT